MKFDRTRGGVYLRNSGDKFRGGEKKKKKKTGKNGDSSQSLRKGRKEFSGNKTLIKVRQWDVKVWEFGTKPMHSTGTRKIRGSVSVRKASSEETVKQGYKEPRCPVAPDGGNLGREKSGRKKVGRDVSGVRGKKGKKCL